MRYGSVFLATLPWCKNPATGASWPAETFIQLVSPLLWQEERSGQLFLYFKGVELFCLLFNDDCQSFFIEATEAAGCFIDVAWTVVTHKKKEASFCPPIILLLLLFTSHFGLCGSSR